MPPKPVEMFQGSDWLTYRWSVAQACDTLDRIRDLCLQMPVAARGSRAVAVPPGGFDIPDEEIADLFGYIAELCDDLGGELDAVHADLLPQLQKNVAHRWMAFEMHQHLRHLRQNAVKQAESTAPSHAPPDEILALAARIKALLKQIDQ
jgi:hypothetical protein